MERPPDQQPASGTEEFVTVDLDLGYLLPQRLGAINIGVRNLFYQEFSFQDDNFRTSNFRAPVYVPARSAFVKLSLVFSSAACPDRIQQPQTSGGK